ncbi:MAG: hypothetical protein WDM77_09760 [Steroidobacteraceae bacterium]
MTNDTQTTEKTPAQLETEAQEREQKNATLDHSRAIEADPKAHYEKSGRKSK